MIVFVVAILTLEKSVHFTFSWIVYSVATLDEAMEVLFIQWTFTAPEDQDEDIIDKMLLKFQTFAKYLSKQLEGRDYLCGNK